MDFCVRQSPVMKMSAPSFSFKQSPKEPPMSPTPMIASFIFMPRAP